MDIQSASCLSNVQGNEIEKLSQEYSQKLSLDVVPPAIQEQSLPSSNNNSHNCTILDDKYSGQIFQYIFNVNRRINQKFFTLEDWDSIINALKSQDLTQMGLKYFGFIGLRKLLATENHPPIQKVIDAGLVPMLVQFAKQVENPQMQFQALWSLTNIASGDSQQTETVVQNEGMQIFIECLSSPILPIAEQAMWAIGNLAGDNTDYRNQLIQYGAIQRLINLLQNTFNSQAITKHGIWALSNLCRGNPKPKYKKIKEGVLFCCKYLVETDITQPDILIDILWVLAYPEQIRNDFENQLSEKLIVKICSFFNSPTVAIVIPSLRIIANLFEKQCLAYNFINNKCIDLLFPLLSHQIKAVRRQACFVIGRLTDIHNFDIDDIFPSPNIAVKLLEMFQKDEDFSVKTEVAYLFAHLSCHNKIQKVFQFYLQADILKYYVDMLKCGDTKRIADSLKCMYRILNVGQKCKINGKNVLAVRMNQIGATHRVDQLREHLEEDISEQATKIFQAFFSQDNHIESQEHSDSPNENEPAPAAPAAPI